MIKVLPSAPPTDERTGAVDADDTAPLSANDLAAEMAPFVWRTLRYLGVHDHQLPDVAQDVLIILFRKAHTFRGRSSVKTWVYRICQRQAFASRRRERLERSRSELSDVDEGQDAGHDRIEARVALKSALAQLDEDKRLVFVLYEIEGLSMREISEIAECPLQTAYSRLHAARELVALAFSERREETGK